MLGGALLFTFHRHRGLALIDLAGEAELDAPNGTYPVFSDRREWLSEVTLSGDTRRSFTPPFPSELTFGVHVPRMATLELSTALVMMQEVRRAQVEFTVDVTLAGDTVTVFTDQRSLAGANRWRDARVDLARFAGNDVLLTLRAAPSRARDQALWSSRIQAVWGEPRVRATPSAIAEAERALRGVLERVTSRERRAVRPVHAGFLVDLALAGVLALVPFGRFRPMPAGAASLFALAATLMIAVVQSSVALALGLLGALSIIRFRAPVRTREQLVHLLFVVALALALGTGQRAVALMGAFVYLLLTGIVRLLDAGGRRCFRVVASAPDDEEFEGRARRIVESGTLESLEVSDGVIALTAHIELRSTREVSALMARAFDEVPNARVSIRPVEEAVVGF